MVDDDDYSFFALRTVGWGVLLIIFMTISYLNANKMTNKKPLMIFGFISWAVLVFLPYIMNSEYVLGPIPEDEYDESEMIGLSLKRTLPNLVITIIYFGFFVNAITKKLNKGDSFKDLTARTRVGDSAGENYKLLAASLGKQFSTTVYMAIFIVLINVFSTGYIYLNCEDVNTNFIIRSIVMSQYNIVIITVIGVITYIVSKMYP